MHQGFRSKPSLCRRMRDLYEFRKMTDAGFRATVIAVEVLVCVVALVVVLFFTFNRTDFNSADSVTFRGSPFTNQK